MGRDYMEEVVLPWLMSEGAQVVVVGLLFYFTLIVIVWLGGDSSLGLLLSCLTAVVYLELYTHSKSESKSYLMERFGGHVVVDKTGLTRASILLSGLLAGYLMGNLSAGLIGGVLLQFLFVDWMRWETAHLHEAKKQTAGEKKLEEVVKEGLREIQEKSGVKKDGQENAGGSRIP